MKQSVIAVSKTFSEWITNIQQQYFGPRRQDAYLVSITHEEISWCILTFVDKAIPKEAKEILRSECLSVIANRKERASKRRIEVKSRVTPSPSLYKFYVAPRYKKWFDQLKSDLSKDLTAPLTAKEFSDSLMMFIERVCNEYGKGAYWERMLRYTTNVEDRWQRTQRLWKRRREREESERIANLNRDESGDCGGVL